jgi:hypothetical protein
MAMALCASAATAPSAQAAGQTTVTYFPDQERVQPDPAAHEPAAGQQATGAAPLEAEQLLTVPPHAPVFATPEDAAAFWELSRHAYTSPVPDAATVARSFIREHLGVDGDTYVVAHFADAASRAEGKPDHVVTLTHALMEAFPEHSRHGFFAGLSDTVGGLASGGKATPSVFAFVESTVKSGNVRACLAAVGKYLWAHTGPGYVYNTFIAKDNVIETVSEDARPLDDAFGVYRDNSAFTEANKAPFRLSGLVDMFSAKGLFSELPHVKRLNADLDLYWTRNGAHWPVLARYTFVEHARAALATGILTEAQYERVMAVAAPDVPLQGPVTLRQLRGGTSSGTAEARRFDINGYHASDIVRFIAPGGEEVLYIPGATPSFMAFRDEAALRAWVLRQARDPKTLDALLAHFSIYNRQDGTFWTGVKQGLENIASGRWNADGATVDHANARIQGDIFVDMRVQTEKRVRDDARMESATAWAAWRTIINRTTTLLGPLGYAPPLALPVLLGTSVVSLGTGIDEAVNGRTLAARKAGLEQAVMTVVTNVPLGAAFGKPGSFVPPKRVNGRIGYPMGPVRPPRLPLPTIPENRPWPRLDPVADGEARPPFLATSKENALADGGYLAQTVSANAAHRTGTIIELQKERVDALRHRLDDFRTHSLKPNALGRLVSTDHSIVYRVDSRTPEQLLARNGFGPSVGGSRGFIDIRPMMPGATIGSGSLWGNDTVMAHWSANPMADEMYYNQYAVWTEGQEVASASDNHARGTYDPEYDEVHFPPTIPARDIYLIDSTDTDTREAIARLIESPHVATPYGVPLDAYAEYRAGRLDIDAPNRFSEPPRRHVLGDDASGSSSSSSEPASSGSGGSGGSSAGTSTSGSSSSR